MMQRHEAEGSLDHPEYQAAVTILNYRHVCRLAEWPAPVKRSLDDWNMGPYEAIQGPNEFLYVGNLKDWNRVPDLHRIKAPVMITTGQHDELTPACAMRMKLAMPQSELHVFPNSSHMPFYEEPQLYYPALLNSCGNTGKRRSPRIVTASSSTRPLQLLPVLFGISIITFVLVRSIPGDPARVLLGTKSTPEAIARIRAQFGLDEPLWVQYFYFIKNLFQGEMGTSILYRIDVLRLIGERIGPTLLLVLGSVAAGDRDRRAARRHRGAQPRRPCRQPHPPGLDRRPRLSRRSGSPSC